MIFNILVTAIGVTLCVQLFKIALEYWKSYCMLLRSNCFRGPTAIPFIGNALLFTGTTAELTRRLFSLFNKYRPPFRLWVGPKVIFMIYDPEHIKQILTNPASREKDETDDMLKTVLGDGLLTASGSKWQVHRKAIQPLFHTEALRPLIAILAKRAALVADQIEISEKGTEFQLNDYMMRYTIDSFCETTLGVSLNCTSGNDHSHIDAMLWLSEIVTSRMLKPWLRFDFIFNRTAAAEKYYDSLKYMDEFARNVLKNAKEEIRTGTKGGERNVARQLLRPTEDGYKFTDQEILDEILTLTAAGSETTSSLLTYSIYIMATTPDIQEKVYKEIREVCGEGKTKGSFAHLTLEDLNRLEYLERVFKETMRFFPATALMTRRIGNEINLGEYILPAHCTVMLALYKVHRFEKYWPNANEFNPDRFLPKHPMGPRHTYAYLPFSTGARNCIGMRYATMAAKMGAVTLISRYIFKTNFPQEAKDISLKLNVVLKPTIPITVYAEKRIPGSNYVSQ